MKSSSYTSRGGIGEITNQTHEPFFKKKKKKTWPVLQYHQRSLNTKKIKNLKSIFSSL